jgi:hypothetical protein
MDFFKTTLILMPLLLWQLHSKASEGDYVIVVNHANEIQSLNKKELRAIFLGDLFFWSNKKKVLPARIDTEASFATFLNDIIKMNVENFNSYWRRRLFSGKAIPPKRYSQLSQLADFVGTEVYALAPFPKDALSQYPKLKVLNLTD